MIEEKLFEKARLIRIASEYRNMDPGLLEKVLRALQLLEGLVYRNVPLIFKGGTAVMLLLGVPRRFSVDIDIILENQQNLDKVLQSIVDSTGFSKYEAQNRISRTALKKDHYKLFYDSNVSGNADQPIILDVVYQKNPYGIVEYLPIKSPFDSSSVPSVSVQAPSIDALVGDKLTAFAPHTTGIQYRRGQRDMSLEIIKQLYDIGTLYEHTSSVVTIRNTFYTFVEQESYYRGIKPSVEEVAIDIINTALTISSGGNLGFGDATHLQTGIRRLKSYVFSENYTPTIASTHAARTAYLAATILYSFEDKLLPFTGPETVKTLLIEERELSKLNKLKKINPEALFFWYHVIKLMKEASKLRLL